MASRLERGTRRQNRRTVRQTQWHPRLPLLHSFWDSHGSQEMFSMPEGRHVSGPLLRVKTGRPASIISPEKPPRGEFGGAHNSGITGGRERHFCPASLSPCVCAQSCFPGSKKSKTPQGHFCHHLPVRGAKATCLSCPRTPAPPLLPVTATHNQH